MKTSVKLLCILAFSWTSLALADADENFYLGINGVYGKISLNDTTVDGITYTPSDDNTFGGGITAGFKTSKNFAIETALDGLNQIQYDGENPPTQSYWFSYLAAKPMLNIGPFDAYLRIGAAYVHLQQNNPGDAEDTANTMVRPFGGAGFGFHFNPNVELDLSYNHIQDTTTPINFGMLTLTYHFVTRYEDSGFLAD